VLPALLSSPEARVVSVTSTGRHSGRAVDPDNPNIDGRYDPWRAYGRSKLANEHFALELERRFRAAHATAKSIVTHSGFANTDLQARSVRETGGSRSQRFFHNAVVRYGMTPARSALSLLRAGTDPNAVGGALYAMGELGAARPQAAVRTFPEPEGDDQALGRVRTRDRHHVRGDDALAGGSAYPCSRSSRRSSR
jgi:NAD(P)-dependent dehydrogenase (short-subunit alcohol dehydrogenase family)